MAVEQLVDGIIDLIKKNLIARSNLSSDILAGSSNLIIENSFHFNKDDEIILIDNEYNNPLGTNYRKYEYCKIKSINNTNSITLYSPVLSDWLVSKNCFIQKTIAHAPLYADNVYYGDRSVIPTEEIAITVDPQSLTNEWLSFRKENGMNISRLSERYNLTIRIYIKDIQTEVGYRILNKYTQALYDLFNNNIQLDINDYDTYLNQDALINSNNIIIKDTPDNRYYFIQSSSLNNHYYGIQDNNNVSKRIYISNISYSGGEIILTLRENLKNNFLIKDNAVLIRYGRYIYDSRSTSVTYGAIQKGSAIMRVAEIEWFGEEINEISFTQKSHGINYF